MVGFITPILFFASNKRLRKYTTEEVYPIHQQRNKISPAIKTDETDGKECIELLTRVAKPESFSDEIGERYLNLQSQNKGQWERRKRQLSPLLLSNVKHIVHNFTLLYWASRLSIMIALFSDSLEEISFVTISFAKSDFPILFWCAYVKTTSSDT